MKTSTIIHRSSFLVMLAALLIAGLAGCPADPAEEPAITPVEPEASDADADAQAEQAAAEAEPAFEEYDAYVIAAAAGLRRAPTMDRHIQQGEEGGRIANWLLTLYRGDRVTVTRVEEHDDERWVWVEPPGDLEGWLKEEWLMDTSEGSPATALGELRVFEIPDPTRPRAGQSIDAGTYLVVLDTEGEFSRVNHVGQRTAWVRTRDLSVDDGEVGASRVISRVRWMQSRNDTDGIDALIEGAKEAFPGARLLGALDEIAQAE